MAERAVREALNLTVSSKVITVDCRRFYDSGEARTRHHIGTRRLVLGRLCDHVKFDEFFGHVPLLYLA